jgi:hypothetical protein
MRMYISLCVCVCLSVCVQGKYGKIVLTRHGVRVGPGDGQILSYMLDHVTGGLAEKKRVSLGSQPVTLAPFHANGVRGPQPVDRMCE